MDEFTAHILRVLVEGHEARAGMKERNRALTEYEIARRAGYTSYSYVEFSTTRERDQVRGALDELESGGWVAQWDRAGRYDTFVPTELGIRRANTLDIVQASPSNREYAPAAPGYSDSSHPGGDAEYDAPYLPGAPAPYPPESPPGGRAARDTASAAEGRGHALSPEAALVRLVAQMDEMLALLRSIDTKLGRDG
jgi:hypothetical protein